MPYRTALPRVPRTAAPTTVLITVLALLSFVEPLGTDVYLPAFPRMVADLGTTQSGIQLTLTAFMVGLAVGHLVFGPLSDRLGRRTPLLVGTAVAELAGAACALAPSPVWLVAFRLVHGISAASGMVVARSVVSDIAEGRQAARLYGILMALLGVAPIIAPLVGGALLSVTGWRAIFWLLAGLMVALFFAVVTAVPETLPRDQRHAAGVSTAWNGVRSVLANRVYLGYTLVFSLAFGALFCYVAGSSFLYQGVFGLSVIGNSWALAGTVLIHSATAMSATTIVSHVAPQRLVTFGLGAMVTASLLLGALAFTDYLSLPVALVILAVFVVGSGLVMPNATASAFDSLSHSTGTGSAVLGVLQNGAAAVAAPVVGLFGGDIAMTLSVGMATFAVVAALALVLTRLPAAAPDTAAPTGSAVAEHDEPNPHSRRSTRCPSN